MTVSADASPRPPKTQAHRISSSGTLGQADLVAIARLHAKGGRDQFSEDPTLAYVGREFTIILPSSAIRTSYDLGTQTLTASTKTLDDGVDLADEETEKRTVRQNGFGAKAVVTERRGNHLGIWLPGGTYTRKPIAYTANLPGAEARVMSKALRLRVSGKITKAEGTYAEKNSAVYKKTFISDATIGDPIDLWVSRILLSVTFTKAEWIDSRTGIVISEAPILTP